MRKLSHLKFERTARPARRTLGRRTHSWKFITFECTDCTDADMLGGGTDTGARTAEGIGG